MIALAYIFFRNLNFLRRWSIAMAVLKTMSIVIFIKGIGIVGSFRVNDLLILLTFYNAVSYWLLINYLIIRVGVIGLAVWLELEILLLCRWGYDALLFILIEGELDILLAILFEICDCFLVSKFKDINWFDLLSCFIWGSFYFLAQLIYLLLDFSIFILHLSDILDYLWQSLLLLWRFVS